MITETLYKCETCGAMYETEQEARKCEDSHIQADFITSQYFPIHEKYPETIIITMGNGHNIEYKFRKPVLDIPSDIPYVRNISVGRDDVTNQVILTAIGDNLPIEQYSWVILFDETRYTTTSEEPRLVLSNAASRLFDTAYIVRVKISSPSIEPGQFVVKEID